MDLQDYIASLPAGPERLTDFAGFGLTRSDLRRLRAALSTQGIAHQVVECAHPDPGITAKPALPLLIWQEQPVQELMQRLDVLLNRILLPARLARQPIIWLSQPALEAYLQPVSSAGLHSDPAGLWRLLHLEQLSALWQDSGLEPLSPEPIYALDDDLDESQRAAVTHLHGPIRVLAPAGSGKTSTLINRIIHLINQGVEPGTLLALAFNKKAADEMVARLQLRGIAVAKRLHQPGVVVRTFHGFGYEIIRRTLGWSYDAESEPERVRKLMQQAVARHHKLVQRRNQDALDPFLAALNRAKMDLLPLERMTVETEEESLPFGPVFDDFLRLQKEHRFCNFDDMIYLALVLLLDRPGLRQELQKRFRFLLVDEFQDLNAAQIMLMNLLALPQNNLFVVGDDDQMIYGWRGADVHHILNFTARYGGAVDCTLTTNYRSTQAVVRHAAWLIGNNRHRVVKPMQTAPAAPPGQVLFQSCGSLWQQAQEAVRWIMAVRQESGAAWSAFAILFRYHAYKYVTAILLDAAGQPHTAVDGSSLAQTAVGRDVHAWLSLILKGDEASAEALARALKRPNRFFPNHFINGIASLEDLAYAAESNELEDWLSDAVRTFLSDLQYLRELVVRKEKPEAYLTHMSMIIGLHDFYQQQKRPFMALDEAGLEVLLDVLITISRSYPSLRGFFDYLDQALTTPGRPAPAREEQDTITLSTIHAAKGREFRYVVLYNLNGPGSCPEEETEEERRVAYVGATRAAEALLVLGPSGVPGGFIGELAFDPEFAGLSNRRLAEEKERLERKAAKQQPHDPGPAGRAQKMTEELARRSALGRQ
jgi:DNA helicase-2/ATP-dependent DNA helicase PcrA